ncbi:MAG: hypothetical protein H6981_06945 [Gammaproteobacteria bacterium]|nr:hypothetical protein [Gammaproteobacteria bacterium]MCP5136520.1 hypothetical protein [Gammaproteobacteria bacterium]
MIGKVLFALVLLIVIAMVLARSKRAPSQDRAQSVASPTQPKINVARQTAWLFIGIVLLISVVGFIWQWQDRQQEVTVAVIDTQTGKTVEYRSRANLVEDRRFETLDGRRIQVAGNERIEVRK